MSLLPDIENGELIIPEPAISLEVVRPYYSKRKSGSYATLRHKPKKEDFISDPNLEALNNLGHRKITKDFADSPYADRV